MAYSDFSLRKVKEQFELTLVEGVCFLPEITPLMLSTPYLQDVLQESLPLAISMGSRCELPHTHLTVECGLLPSTTIASTVVDLTSMLFWSYIVGVKPYRSWVGWAAAEITLRFPQHVFQTRPTI
jgi:hypothetical protein